MIISRPLVFITMAISAQCHRPCDVRLKRYTPYGVSLKQFVSRRFSSDDYFWVRLAGASSMKRVALSIRSLIEILFASFL